MERTRLVGEDKTRPACGLSRTGTPPFKLKEAWWKPFDAGPVLVKLSDTGLEGARLLLTGKDVDEGELGACELLMLTLGVFVIVIAPPLVVFTSSCKEMGMRVKFLYEE